MAGKITYRAPYGNVLKQSRWLGIHDLTEQKIHEARTIPRIKIWGEIMGLDMQVSNWQDDGMITVSLTR